MKEQREHIVRDLVEHGHAFVPIDIDLVESAESAARIFLAAEAECWQDWHFERDDATKFGIIEELPRQVGPFSHRHKALSFAHDLSRKRPAHDPHTKACLGAVTNLYRDMRRRVSDLCVELNKHCPIENVGSRIRDTFELGDERATTLLLRSNVCGQRSLIGDVLQADSVLSMFFSNEGSEIWLKDSVSKKWRLRSPPYGSALLFFGLKVEELRNPHFTPSLYRIDTHSDRPINGTILHVQIKKETPAAVPSATVQPLLAE